jgi:segregation and condensation protein B
MPLDAQIEAILFWKGEPMKITKLAAILSKSDEEVQTALAELQNKLTGRGLQLLFKDDEVMIGTHAELSPLIEKLIKEDLVRDLGKAGLETLSVILYRGPVTRRDIDYIRGVNSNFILRNLLIRGLVEKVANPKDERSFHYKPTFQLLSYLGVTKIEELPEYADVRKEIDTHEATQHVDETQQQA